MNVLVVSPFVPAPDAPAGAPRAIFDRISLLAGSHRVSVVAFRAPDEPDGGAALAAMGVELVTVPRAESSQSHRSARWRKRLGLLAGLATKTRPMLVQEFEDARMRTTLARLVRTNAPDAVFVEHALMAQYVPDLRTGGVPTVVLTEHDAAASETPVAISVALPAGLRRTIRALDRRKWARYLRASYDAATIVLVPTDPDARLVRALAPRANVGVVPFGLAGDPTAPSAVDATSVGTTTDAQILAFVGNFEHAPNRDAAAWLATAILPLVRRDRPGVQLWLVGRHPSPDVLALASDAVRVIGDVPTVSPYLEAATLFVAPIRQGAGMRMKILEAMAAGVPIVATPLAVEGIGAIPGRDAIVADTAEKLAAAIVAALDSPTLRAALAEAGRDLVASPHARTARISLLEQILS